jgi:hypothetical protein
VSASRPSSSALDQFLGAALYFFHDAGQNRPLARLESTEDIFLPRQHERPNFYVIAEQFGTLARLFPDRIDLGLGRAPGTDQLTLRALRRTPEAAENFPQDVLEVQAFLVPAGPNQRIQAVPIYDVLNATDYVTPALEILDTRIVRLDPTSKKTRSVVDTIADNAANAGIVTGGRPVRRPREYDLRWIGSIVSRNGAIEETGLAAAVLNHPAMGIVWLASRLAAYGSSIAAGQLV